MEELRNRFITTLLVALLLCALPLQISVQADGPENVQFVGLNALTYSGADESGAFTSNATIRQGDHLILEIPIENTGATPQVASIVLNVSQASWNETVYFADITIDALTTHVVNYFSSSRVVEGLLNVEMSINNTSAELVDSVEVGPPPLPSVDLSIELVTQSFASGDLIQFNLTSSNENGERSFDGHLRCDFLGEQVYNSSLGLDVEQNQSNLFDIYARPGVLECQLGGDRNQSDETLVTFSLEGLASAVFDEAGSSGLSISGGPWHVGDGVQASFILKNQGDASGTAQLRIVNGDDEHVSEDLVLDPGAAGELEVEVSDLDAGVHNLSWSVVSQDGLVLAGLEGISTLTIRTPQAMFADVDAQVDATGVTLHWNVSISDGLDREVKLRYGYRVSGTDTFVNEQIVTLGSGTVAGQTTLGQIPGNTVVLRMEPIGWSSTSSSYIASSSYESVVAAYSFSIDSIPLPKQPLQGQDVTVTVSLQNTGPVQGPVGELYLMDSSGRILAETSTEALQSTSSRNLDFTFAAPYTNELLLNVEWRFEDTILEGEQSFLLEPVEVDDKSFEVPYVAIGGGLAAACFVIFVLHLRRGTSSAEPDSTGPSKQKKSKPTVEKKEPEPVEKTCPSCSRTLRIPGDYSGTVRCPDCSEKFQVEAEETFDIDDELDSIEEVEPLEKIVEEKVEISCPECPSKLRVPSDYKGSVRCPQCSVVFSVIKN